MPIVGEAWRVRVGALQLSVVGATTLCLLEDLVLSEGVGAPKAASTLAPLKFLPPLPTACAHSEEPLERFQ